MQTLSLSYFAVEPSHVGAAGAWTAVTNFQVLPARGAGITVIDDGTGGEQLVAFLTSKKLV